MAARRAGLGVFLLRVLEDVAQQRRVIEGLRDALPAGRGSAVIVQGSPELKTHVDVWGPIGDALSMMRNVKKQFDPVGVLSPGRGPAVIDNENEKEKGFRYILSTTPPAPPDAVDRVRGLHHTIAELEKLSRIADVAGSKAQRSSCIVSRSTSENIFPIEADLSAPTPCSPVMDPPLRCNTSDL